MVTVTAVSTPMGCMVGVSTPMGCVVGVARRHGVFGHRSPDLVTAMTSAVVVHPSYLQSEAHQHGLPPSGTVVRTYPQGVPTPLYPQGVLGQSRVPDPPQLGSDLSDTSSLNRWIAALTSLSASWWRPTRCSARTSRLVATCARQAGSVAQSC